LDHFEHFRRIARHKSHFSAVEVRPARGGALRVAFLVGKADFSEGDVFRFDGRAGPAIAAEVYAR
jgi:hypothetical protein